MLVVVALGGNALLRRGEPMTAENQPAVFARRRNNSGRSIRSVDSFAAARGSRLVIVPARG